MCKRILIILLLSFMLVPCIKPGFADESDGDLYTFCPYISTLYYNSMLKNFLDLSDTQAAWFQVSSDGSDKGNLVYSNLLQDTIFFFGGVTSEFDTANTAYIYCSLKDSSTLKNIPMLIWASVIQMKYYGRIEETGSSFLEWVNQERRDGDTFSTPYFTAIYSEEPYINCTLLLVKQ